jgi:23S rRNA (guanosine2251-2'-O)-methyltransferase
MDKAAAGTIEFVPIARVTNLSRAIESLKDAGFWVLGMDGYAKNTIDKINKSGKTAIVMGSEGKGMRRLVEENCDSSVKLPISPQVESLNVSTAAAIALYELSK